jgi:hypothetical protein
LGKTIKNYQYDGMKKIKNIKSPKPRKKLDVQQFSDEDDCEYYRESDNDSHIATDN